jgi:PD-(D/E)XK nuclease superfamily
MLLSTRKLPPYSLTGDILSFETCPLQYRYNNLGGLPSSRPVQLWFGQFIHGVLEDAYRRYEGEGDRLKPFPWSKSETDEISDRIIKRLKAQGLHARSSDLEVLGKARAERAINLLGPHLLPLINRVEVRLSGARAIDPLRMPKEWKEYRNLDRYELVGVIDVVSHVELSSGSPENPLVSAVRNAVPSLPAEFEIIVDYKGMRRPSTKRKNGRLDLKTYEWQLQNYANLRDRQREGPQVVAGVLLFLNELHPTRSDLREWIDETRKDITDTPCEEGWRQLSDVPDAEKLKRAIHVTAVTPSSQQKALSEFDAVVQKIEACRGAEIADRSLFAAWKGNPEDKATCDACDARTFCPELRKRQDSRVPPAPTLPSA